MVGYDHLSRRVEISTEARDRLRDELGAYGCGAIMLDGISRDAHQVLLTNSLYQITPAAERQADLPTQDETLFDLAPEVAMA